MRNNKSKKRLLAWMIVLVVLLFAFGFTYSFVRSLNPDSVDLNDGSWTAMFTIPVQEFENKKIISVFYREPQKIDSRFDTVSKEKPVYDFVIVRDSIVPFGVKVISPVYRSEILFAAGTRRRDTDTIHSTCHLDPGTHQTRATRPIGGGQGRR